MGIVDNLTNSANFLAIRIDHLLERLAELYIHDIVRLHGIHMSIVSIYIIFDRDLRFTSIFWGSLPEGVGTKLKISTSFHPHTEVQSERVIHILEDIIRS